MQFVLDLVATYGYVVVLLVVLAESAGLPLPGETSLLVAAAIAATGKMSLPGVIVAAALGAILGDTAGYWVGRSSGLRLLRRHGRLLRFDERKLAQAEAFFAKHGEKTVFLGRFVPIGRIFSALLAGVSRMNYGRFLLWNAAGGIVWATLMGTIGYIFGHQLPLVERLIGQFGFGLLAVIIVAVVGRITWQRRAAIAAWWTSIWEHPSRVRLHASLASLSAIPRTLSYRTRCILVGGVILAFGATALLLT
jgi:membrane protein DedA with SNARE-associated domain